MHMKKNKLRAVIIANNSNRKKTSEEVFSIFTGRAGTLAMILSLSLYHT